jgi:hypothetical protein
MRKGGRMNDRLDFTRIGPYKSCSFHVGFITALVLQYLWKMYTDHCKLKRYVVNMARSGEGCPQMLMAVERTSMKRLKKWLLFSLAVLGAMLVYMPQICTLYPWASHVMTAVAVGSIFAKYL